MEEKTFTFDGGGEEATIEITLVSDNLVEINMHIYSDECERSFSKDELKDFIDKLNIFYKNMK